MNKFFERPKVPKFTKKKRLNLNSPISIKKIEFVVENYATKALQTHISLANSNEHLR